MDDDQAVLRPNRVHQRHELPTPATFARKSGAVIPSVTSHALPARRLLAAMSTNPDSTAPECLRKFGADRADLSAFGMDGRRSPWLSPLCDTKVRSLNEYW